MRGTGAVFVFLVLMSSASGGAVKRALPALPRQDERSVPDGVAGVSGEGPGPSKKQCGPTTRSATRDARDAPAAPASVDDVAAGDSDEEELPELDLLARLSTVQRARLEALQGDGGVTIWSFAYAVGYKASAAAVGRIRAMLRAVCYDDGDDDAAIASLAADIGLECDLKVRTRKATREMIDALIKIWSRVLTLGGDTVLPRALRWALAVVMLDKIDLAGEEVDGEPQLVGLLRVLAAAGIVEQDPDDASVIGPGPAWREYAGELNGNARLPQLADFVGILMEMRLLRGVPCPGCLCASCHQGVNDVMTLVARLPAIKAAFPELGFKSEAEILKAHGVPATYSYEPADSEKYPTMPLNVLSFVTQRKIFGEVASGARPRIGVKIMDSATGKFDGKVWVLTAADVRNCSSRKHDGYSAEVLDLFAAAAYNATGVRYELREGVKKGGVYTMNVGVGPSTRAVRTFFQPRIKLYSDRNDTISGTVVLGTEFKIVELDDDGEEGATLLEKGVVPKPTAEAIAGAKAAFARDAAALRKARGLPTAEEKERARREEGEEAQGREAQGREAQGRGEAQGAKPKAAPVAPTVIHVPPPPPPTREERRAAVEALRARRPPPPPPRRRRRAAAAAALVAAAPAPAPPAAAAAATPVVAAAALSLAAPPPAAPPPPAAAAAARARSACPCRSPGMKPGVVIAFELGGVWYRARIPRAPSRARSP
ncbi:serine/threonine kinase [Aureococcus anophagefferens]|nr:serine/threonine kinase [Aureococcus anophagefferens]